MTPQDLPQAVRSTMTEAERSIETLVPKAEPTTPYCRAHDVRLRAQGQCLTYIADALGNGLTAAVERAARQGAAEARPVAKSATATTWAYRAALPVVIVAVLRGCQAGAPTEAEQQVLAAMAQRAATAAVSNAVPQIVQALSPP